MFTVLIVEDDNKIRDQIEKTIQQMKEDFKTLAVHDIKSALELAEMVAVDIFILDVKLPDGNGIELAKKLRVTYPNQPIIIESSEQDLSFQKLVHDEIENLAFLEKPYSWEKLQTKMERALDIVKNQTTRKLVIEQNGFTYFFELNEVMYIETIKGSKWVDIVLYDRERDSLVRKTLKGFTLNKLIEDLPYKNALMRCHNSYIVNPQMITRWNYSPAQGNTIILKYQNIEIPIGKTYRNKIAPLV